MTSSSISFSLLKSTAVPKSALSPRDLEALAGFAFSRQKVTAPVELTVEITGHKRIQELNRRFRGVDRTTDVISFRDEMGREKILCGDIAINVQQAALQALKMRHPLKREMRLLLIHGILHLLGYTDYTPIPRRRMFKRQNAILRSWETKQR